MASVKFGMKVRALDSVLRAKLCKNRLRGYTLGGKYTNFGDISACRPTSLKPQPWTLAWGYGPGTPSPAPNFVQVAEGDLSFRGKFLPKIRNFRDFELHFCIHNVEILFKRTNLGINQRHKISSKSLKGLPLLQCLRSDAYRLLVVLLLRMNIIAVIDFTVATTAKSCRESESESEWGSSRLY